MQEHSRPSRSVRAVRTTWDTFLYFPLSFFFLLPFPPLPIPPGECLLLPLAVLLQLPRCWLVLLGGMFCFALLFFCLSPSLPPFPVLSFALPACCVLPLACSLPLLFPLFSRCWLCLAVLVTSLLTPGTCVYVCDTVCDSSV